MADAEALVSEYVLWVHLNEFGKIVQRNLIRAVDLAGFTEMIKKGSTLDEMGIGYKNGRVDWHVNGGGIECSVYGLWFQSDLDPRTTYPDR